MTNQPQTKNLEPIRRVTYDCPIEGCGFTTGDYDKAVEHANVPVDKPLPKGLVYKMDFNDTLSYHIVSDEKGKIEEMSIPNVETHTSTHTTIYINSGRGYSWGIDVNSKLFRKWLVERGVSLLSKEEFKNFKEKYIGYMDKMKEFNSNIMFEPEELIRTTPELEALVAEKEAASLVGEE